MGNKVIHIVLDILFPRHCFGCKKYSDALICARCNQEAAFLGNECLFCGIKTTPRGICDHCSRENSLQMILWPWRYSHPIARNIISTFKYRRKKVLVDEIAHILKKKMAEVEIPPEIMVIPVPLAREKEKERGFNQSNLIAEKLGYPTRHNLVRTKHTPPQARAGSRKERQEQIKGAFQVTNPENIRGKNILLVDDVSTTGATLREAAITLRNGGTGTIYALIIAHG